MTSERQRAREEAERERVKRVNELRVGDAGQRRSFVEEGRAEERAARRAARGDRLIATGRLLTALGSLRVIFSALIGSVLLGLVLSLLWTPLFLVAVPAFFASWFGGAIDRLNRR